MALQDEARQYKPIIIQDKYNNKTIQYNTIANLDETRQNKLSHDKQKNIKTRKRQNNKISKKCNTISNNNKPRQIKTTTITMTMQDKSNTNARQGKTRQHKTIQYKTIQDKIRQDKISQEKTIQYKTI